ncbi:MAG: glycosyltransferase family 4 protein, partial [Patescibacteria group bacterium]
MNIALVHDHFAQDGGAERVFWMLAEMYPQADIFTILYNRNYIAEHLPGRQPQATFIQNLPLGVSKYQWHLPLMPMAIESLNFEKYDLIISSASSFAKGIISRPGAIHICYCHTPTRYLWHYSSQYLQELRLPKFFKKIVGWEVSRIRSWDRGAAERVDYFIANS